MRLAEIAQLEAELYHRKYYNGTEIPKGFQSAVEHRWHDCHVSKYKQVRALLVSWKFDNLNLASEVNLLCEELIARNYIVDKFLIPDRDSTRKLNARVGIFIKDAPSDTLLIFYYGGHGNRDPETHELSWAASGITKINVNKVQRLFEDSPVDTLLIYDSCYSANLPVRKGKTSGKGVTELIAACAMYEETPGNSRKSLTRMLIQTLQANRSPFYASELPHKILERRLARNSGSKIKPAPVHLPLTSVGSGRQIKLAPIPSKRRSVSRKVVPVSSNRLMIALKVPENSKMSLRPDLKEWILMAPARVLGVDLLEPEEWVSV